MSPWMPEQLAELSALLFRIRPDRNSLLAFAEHLGLRVTDPGATLLEAELAQEVVFAAEQQGQIPELLCALLDHAPSPSVRREALRLVREYLNESGDSLLDRLETRLVPANADPAPAAGHYRSELLPLLRSVPAPELELAALMRAGLRFDSTQEQFAVECWVQAWRLLREQAQPAEDARRAVDAALFAARWPVRHFALRDVRQYGSLEWPTWEGDKPHHWLFFIGENGVGKTSLLRALCLALCPDEETQALLTTLGEKSPTVRLGSAYAEAKLLGGWELPPVTITENGRGGACGDRPATPRPFVVAYGARRGSALGGADRDVQFGLLDAVATLFQESATLIHGETWLLRKHGQALQGGRESPAARFFAALQETLVALLPGVRELRVDQTDGVWVTGPGPTTVPLAALSDGYLTTLGWVVDMVARWTDQAQALGVEVGGNFAAQMSGVALVDDIDLFLHPRWQRDLIVQLRGTFPRMTFLATTHNPLTLLGAEPGEIQVLRRASDDTIKLETHVIPKGMDVDAVLTSPLFALMSTLDADSNALIARHQEEVLRDPHSPESRSLERRLRARTRNPPAGTSQDRLRRAERIERPDEENLTPEEDEQARRFLDQVLGRTGEEPK